MKTKKATGAMKAKKATGAMKAHGAMKAIKATGAMKAPGAMKAIKATRTYTALAMVDDAIKCITDAVPGEIGDTVAFMSLTGLVGARYLLRQRKLKETVDLTEVGRSLLQGNQLGKVVRRMIHQNGGNP